MTDLDLAAIRAEHRSTCDCPECGNRQFCEGCEEDYPCTVLALLDLLGEARGILQFHNLTPSGKVRHCLDGCIACDLIARLEERQPA